MVTKQSRRDIPEYNSWRAMIERCYNKNCVSYKYYGEQGVEVAEEWRGRGGFERFFAHIGPRPEGKKSVDRIDNDGNYEPGNVRWADSPTQNNNRGFCVVVEWQGKKQNLMQWSRELDIPYETLRSRYKKQLPVEQLLSKELLLPRVLTDCEVLEIRYLVAAGHSYTDVGKRYDISPATVGDIHHRRIWKHLEIR